MRGRWLAKTVDAERFLYSQFEEFPPCFCSAEGSRTEYQQLHLPCLGDNQC